MRGNVYVGIILIFAFACSEEELPTGITGDQVERLLSGQEGSKVWNRVVNSENCADSSYLFFQLVENANNDSLDVFKINTQNNCSLLDTVALGKSRASSIAGGELFTDSLIFSSGDYWIVNQITSLRLELEENTGTYDYASE